MGQINVYFPDDLETEIRKKAEKENKSPSVVVVELTQKQLQSNEYPQSFWDAFGALSKVHFKIEKLKHSDFEERESFE